MNLNEKSNAAVFRAKVINILKCNGRLFLSFAMLKNLMDTLRRLFFIFFLIIGFGNYEDYNLILKKQISDKRHTEYDENLSFISCKPNYFI